MAAESQGKQTQFKAKQTQSHNRSQSTGCLTSKIENRRQASFLPYLVFCVNKKVAYLKTQRMLCETRDKVSALFLILPPFQSINYVSST